MSASDVDSHILSKPPSKSARIILAADRPRPLAEFDRRAAEIGAVVVYGGATRPEQVVEPAREADAVIVFRTPVSAEAIAGMTRCRIIVRQGIGFDLVDIEAATRAGIFVSNVPDYCVEEVASHAAALALASVRNLFAFHRVMVEKGFGTYKDSRAISALETMRVGIVGLGKIGRAFARRMKAFDCAIAAYDPYVAQDIFDAFGVERVRQLGELLAASDLISVHAPLTPETRRMFGAEQFAAMKPGAHFINTARGKIVDLTALDAALASGHLAAAALDVFESEPLDPAHPILKRANLIATTHVGYHSEDSVKRVVTSTIEEVLRALRGERPLNLVNPEAYAHRGGLGRRHLDPESPA